jgi:hypothetical protein
MRTGGGMEEGMGMVQQGNALSEDLGPKFGRGMGMATEERPVTHAVGQDRSARGHAGHGGKRRIPGFPQDMFMPMDEAVAKPETYGLARNWSGATQGMMTIVRVLPPAQYDEVVRRVDAARNAPAPQLPKAAPRPHQH